jgi:hypothetical protein
MSELYAYIWMASVISTGLVCDILWSRYQRKVIHKTHPAEYTNKYKN